MASNSVFLVPSVSGNSTILPVLSPSQRVPTSVSAKGFCALGRGGPESSCSTADSLGSHDGSDSENDVLTSHSLGTADQDQDDARELCAADVEWLLNSQSAEQKIHFDRSLFHRECQRIFRMMDKDESGFLDQSELESVIAHLIPGPRKTLSSSCGRHLIMSIQSVLAAFDKDSDRQLSSEEFPDFVRFCYAWRSKGDLEDNTDMLMPGGREATNSMPCGAAHRCIRRVTPPAAICPPRLSSASGGASKSLRRSGSTPHFGCTLSENQQDVLAHFGCPALSQWNPSETSSRRPSKSSVVSRMTSTCPSTRSSTPETLPAIVRPIKTMSRSSSNPVTRAEARSAVSSRSGSRSRPGSSKSRPGTSPEPESRRSSKSRPSSRPSSPQPAGMKVVRREELVPRQLLALKALLADLVTSYHKLPDLIAVLLHNTLALDGSAAYSQESLDHVCELISSPVSDQYDLEPSSNGEVAIAMFLGEIGHVAEDPISTDESDPVLLVNQALQVVSLLCLRWFAMENHTSLPDMSDYQRQRWLPPAFSHLVGQILWRHRTSTPLKFHTPVVQHVGWIATSHGAEEDMIDRCNIVFKALSGSGGQMKLSQWRRVMELLAMNPDLRVRTRRCDAVKACYGDTDSHSESGCMNRKQFKLTLLKTADLMSVHPLVIFQTIASHAEDLERSSITAKHSKEGSATLDIFK